MSRPGVPAGWGRGAALALLILTGPPSSLAGARDGAEPLDPKPGAAEAGAPGSASGPTAFGAASAVEIVDAAALAGAIGAERGKVVVVNFWATWCDPCREEFPDLVRLAGEQPARLALITVSLDDPDDLDARVRPFLREMRAPGRALIKGRGDPDAFIRSVDPKWSGALPATFIHAPDGRRAHAIHGATNYVGLKALVTPLLPEAR